jgi:hypothetical protein
MRSAWFLVLALLVAGCTPGAPRTTPLPRDRASIEAALMRHIEVLASDDFGGRQPGTPGEAKTLRYLAREWQGAGLQSGTNDPANPWFAPVELALSVPDRSAARFYRGGRPIPMPEGSVTVFSTGARGLVERAPVVFVGKAGDRLDRSELAGRVVIMTGDHPGLAVEREAAARAGAAAVLVLVRDDAERAALTAFRRRGSYRIAGSEDAGALDGYISSAALTAIAGEARAAELLAAGQVADFKPVALDATAALETTAAQSVVRTFNLVARLPGRKPAAGAVLLLAHWDHFGACAEPPAGDLICNGAVDNASGLAVLTELARRLASGPQLDRDVYFLATTAEEWGLLGAQAFAENPPVPLQSIVAAFNLDTVAVAPAGSPVAIVGKGLTPLDKGVAQVMRETGRRESDERMAQGYVRRQDGWALIQRDVPAISVTSAFSLEEPLDRYIARDYHQPSDEAAGIELGGAADDLALHLALVRYFADPARWPAAAGKSPATP